MITTGADGTCQDRRRLCGAMKQDGNRTHSVDGSYTVLSMFFQSGKRFGADHVLDPTGIFCGDSLVYADGNQKVGQEGVPFVNFFGNFPTFFQERDMSVLVHFNVGVEPQIFHGYADAWFGKRKLVGNVDGADITKALAQDQDGFQIVFGRFVKFHMIHLASIMYLYVTTPESSLARKVL